MGASSPGVMYENQWLAPMGRSYRSRVRDNQGWF